MDDDVGLPAVQLVLPCKTYLVDDGVGVHGLLVALQGGGGWCGAVQECGGALRRGAMPNATDALLMLHDVIVHE